MSFEKLRSSVFGKLLIFPLVVGALQIYELIETYPDWDKMALFFGLGLMPIRWAEVSILPLVIYRFRSRPHSKVASCLLSAALIPVNIMGLFLVSVVPFRSILLSDDSAMPAYVSVALVNSLIGGLFLTYYVLRQERKA